MNKLTIPTWPLFLFSLSDDPETRDAWWTELRTEIRSHARALGCHAVIGYCELTSIWWVDMDSLADEFYSVRGMVQLRFDEFISETSVFFKDER